MRSRWPRQRYWGGISDAELYAYKQSGGVLDYRAEADPASPASPSCLRCSRRRTARGTAARSPRWWKDCCGGPGMPSAASPCPTDQVQANLRKAIAIIRQWERERP